MAIEPPGGRDIASFFPRLKRQASDIESPATPMYNCIAWAAGDSHRWWWPAHDSYWPKDAPAELSRTAFVAAFFQLGYDACGDGRLEQGYEKVALYEKEGQPTHMARQLPSGRWTSKLGRLEDIEHTLAEDLEGDVYGTVAAYLRRLSSSRG